MSQSKLTDNQIAEILSEIQYKDWQLFNGCNEYGAPFLRVQFYERCSVTGQVELQRSRKWLLSYYMTKTEIVKTALLCIKAAAEHELLEAFKYKGVRIFNPHHSVEALIEIDGKVEVREPIYS